MNSFKITCTECGNDSVIRQYKDSVYIEGNIKIDYWDREYDNNKISFICECGNKVEDK